MWEIKRREQVIRCLLEDKCNLLYPIVILEVIFFQLRKILEIIAMSPMLVNEKEYREESKKPEFDWRLKQIAKNLKTANPDYYPSPIMIKKHTDGIDNFMPVKSGFLTIDGLLEAYDHCSDFLHSRNPLKEGKDKDFDKEYKFIKTTIDKIHTLLQTHTVKPTSEDIFYYIGMNKDDDRPHGNVFGLHRKLTDEENNDIYENDGFIPKAD